MMTMFGGRPAPSGGRMEPPGFHAATDAAVRASKAAVPTTSLACRPRHHHHTAARATPIHGRATKTKPSIHGRAAAGGRSRIYSYHPPKAASPMKYGRDQTKRNMK